MKKMEQYRHSKDMEVTIRLKTGKKKNPKREAKGNIEKEAMFFKRVINTIKYHNNFTTFIN